MKRHNVSDSVMQEAYEAALEMFAGFGLYVYRGGHHIAVGRDKGERLCLATQDSATTIDLSYY